MLLACCLLLLACCLYVRMSVCGVWVCACVLFVWCWLVVCLYVSLLAVVRLLSICGLLVWCSVVASLLLLLLFPTTSRRACFAVILLRLPELICIRGRGLCQASLRQRAGTLNGAMFKRPCFHGSRNRGERGRTPQLQAPQL